MDIIEINQRLKLPDGKFSSEEIELIDNHYLELNYNSIYESMYEIQSFFLRNPLIPIEKQVDQFNDFSAFSWEKTRLFAIELINSGEHSLDNLIILIGGFLKVPIEQIQNNREFLPLLQQTINLSFELNSLSITQISNEEISRLIIIRINTLVDSYLEMVDVFNFIDYANIAFLLRLNEYDFYPKKIFNRLDTIGDKESVLILLNEIYNQKFGYQPNFAGKKDEVDYFINVFQGNEFLGDKFKTLNLRKRLEFGAQMILDIKQKYPYLEKFGYYIR
jgi:hypothetical protein